MVGSEEPLTYLVVVARPLSYRNVDWTRLVTASVTIDPGLVHGAMDTFNVDMTGAPTVIGPFSMIEGQRAWVGLSTEADLAAIKDVRTKHKSAIHYEITVMQIRPEGRDLVRNLSDLFSSKALLGGTSYILRIP
ncbi:MAG: hypothetical protein OEN21_12035 [Myxococcales bacterium]|nr:hypothetical protein [Myxococcales bacterium]